MLANLSPEAKIAVIVSTVIGSFLVGPIVTGIVVLLAAGITYSPWPGVAFISTTLIVIWSWHILWNRFKSSFLVAADIVILFLVLASQGSGNLPPVDPRYNFNVAIVTYIVAILMIVFHSLLALFVALSINPLVQTEMSGAKKKAQA